MSERRPGWMWNLAADEVQRLYELNAEWSPMVRRTPAIPEMYDAGPEAFLEGWLPSEPLIRRETRVVAMGSCFAARFVEWLDENGYNRAFDAGSDESIVRNPFEAPSVVAQQFRWAFGEFDSSLAFWLTPDRRRVEATEERRVALRESLVRAEVLIITLGLAEVFFDKQSGEPIWRVPPRSQADRYGFRVVGTAETYAALETIDRLRRAHMPSTKVLYSVSPVRLGGTFRGISAVVANAASKAIVRATVDDFLRAHRDELNTTYFYFPAYELVTEFLIEPFADNMHLRDHHAAAVLDLFARRYTDAVSPEGDARTFPSSAEGEYQATIVARDRENAHLQAVCDERLAVIETLDAEVKRLQQQVRDREPSTRAPGFAFARHVRQRFRHSAG